MTRFYFTVDCENCDDEIFYGPCMTLMEHDGLPVIPFDMAAQTTFQCRRCGAENYTGDFEIFCEGGDEQVAGDDDDEPAAVSS